MFFEYVNSLLACEKSGWKMGKKGCSHAVQSFALWNQCTAGWLAAVVEAAG